MAYISTSDVKMIREALKEEFPKYRFSVSKGSGGLSVNVAVVKGPSNLLADIGETWAGAGYQDINHYHTHMYGEHESFFDSVVQTIKTAPSRQWYDKSDAMIDYFDTAFYMHVSVGKYGKPYEMVA